MPMYEITAPDGRKFRVSGDGTREEALAHFQSSYKPADLKTTNPGEYDPASPEYQAKYGPTAGMSNDDLFMAGAGKAVTDIGRGIKQIGAWGLDKIAPQQDISSLVTGQDSSRLGKLKAAQDETARLDAPLMATGNGLAGNVTGNVATTLIGGGALSKVPGVIGAAGGAIVNPTTIRGAAAGGALLGALQPVGTNESRLKNAAIGAATSGATQGLVQTIGKVAQPLTKTLTPVDENAVKTLTAAGVPLDAAQKSGSERALQLKRFLTDNPITAGAQTKQAEATASGFTRAALKEVGENADVADETVLGAAQRRIGGEFDRIAAANPIKADNKLLNDLVSVTQGASGELESGQAAVISKQVDEVLAKVNAGQIDGKAYQSIKSTLDRISGGSNPQLGFWARELRGKLDDALERSASGADFDALKVARKQYGALDKVIKSVKPDGNISPAKLYNAANVKGFGQKKAMATGIGQSQLQKLAKAGARIIPERMPNSGTTPRALLQMALPAAAGGAYGYSQDGNLGGAAKYAALGVGAPYLAQRLLNSPAASEYLANGLQGSARGLLMSGPTSAPGLIARQAPLAGLLSLQAQQQ
jgi:hypothetical protein